MSRPQRMTLKQACEDFAISYTAVYEAVRAGDLPAIKPLGSWLVRPEDVEEWLVSLDSKRLEAAS